MRNYIIWCGRHVWVVILLLALASVLAASQVPKVQVDASSKGMMAEGDPALDFYNETMDIFGSDKVLVVFLRDKGLFTPERLADLDDLVFAFEELKGIEKVESLYSATNFKGGNGALESAPLMDWVPETPEEAGEVRLNAQDNHILLDNLVSRDGTATAINLYLDPNDTDPQFNIRMADGVDKIIEEHASSFEEAFMIGGAYTWKSINDTILNDQRTLIPLSVAALMIMLIVTMRSVSGAVLPLITAGTSVLWTVGFMGAAGIPLTVLTFVVPSLIIVIGSTEDVHMLSEYIEGYIEGGTKDKAIKYMATKVGTAVVLTSITTFLGFLSIVVNDIVMLKQFGMTAAFGLLVNPFITFSVGPIYMRLLGPKPRMAVHGEVTKDDFFLRTANRILRLLERRGGRVVALMLGVSLALGIVGLWVRVDNNSVNFFKKDSEIVRRLSATSASLAGVYTFNIRIVSGVPGTFEKPEYVAALAAFQDEVQKRELVDKTISFADYMRLMHQEMNDGDKAFFTTPPSEDLIAQYTLFVPSNELEPFINHDASQANIMVRHDISSSRDLTNTVEEMRGILDEALPKGLTYGFTGENILTNKAADSIASGQAQGIGLLLAVIFVLMSVLFVNMKAGALSLIPNLFPVACFFGIMVIFDIPLNTGTCMVAVVAIGIAVDDTIHFMSRYNTEMRLLQDQMEAMKVCLRAEFRPAFATSLALALGFGVLALSNFVPIMQFGILSAMVMVLALAGDMFITPVLLSKTQLITLWDLMALKLHEKVLSDSPLFQGMKRREVKRVVLLGRMDTRASGEMLVTKGEMGESMFLLLAGRAEVFDRSRGREIIFSSLEPGDVFGEMALVQAGPRTANVRALEDVQYLEITWKGLSRIQRLFPYLAAHLYLNLSRILGKRLAKTNELVNQQEDTREVAPA
jgi:predicted RND superfamily exporter protein